MVNKKITELSSKFGVSNTTVSKVIRHCGGVDSHTRRRILNEIQSLSSAEGGSCDIYCILPDIPHYFWGVLQQSIGKNLPSDLAVKINIYTRLRDEETVLHYLSEAEKMKASAIILSTHMTKCIHETLTALIPGRLIILLSEQHPLPNGFCVGSDPFDDGFAMGRFYRRTLASRRLAVLRLSADPNAERRVNGFLSALSEKAFPFPHEIISVTDETDSEKTAASRIAMLLARYKDSIDCIYTPFGVARLPLAVRKAGFAPHTMLLGHDIFNDFAEPRPPEGFHAVCNQDLYAQGIAALHSAETFVRTGRYPLQKNICIPSVLRTVD